MIKNVNKILGFSVLFLIGILSACQPTTEQPSALPTLTPLRREIIQENAGFVVDLDFSQDGRLFYITQSGDVFIKTLSTPITGSPEPQKILTLDVAHTTSLESGLLSLVFSPTFSDDHQFYIYYTVPNEDNAPVASRIARYSEEPDGQISEETVILDLPARPDQEYHFGGALSFGPDGKLYVVFGDTNLPDEARNPQSPYGAILRINPDGSIPEDNPFPNSYVYAYGIRNGFGLAWNPQTGFLYATENGAECDDELNLIESGKDYGWGLYPYDTCPYPDDAALPLYQWTPTAAPTGLFFYQGLVIPEWVGKLLVCGFNRQELYIVTLSPDGRTVWTLEPTQVAGMSGLCRATIALGPDGWVYTTGDSTIYRIGR